MIFSDTYPTTITLSSWQRGWKRHWVKNSKSNVANFLNKVEQCFLCISYFIFFCTRDGFDFIVCIVLNSIDWFIHIYRVCIFTYWHPDKCTCLIITSLFMFMNFTVFCQNTCFHLIFIWIWILNNRNVHPEVPQWAALQRTKTSHLSPPHQVRGPGSLLRRNKRLRETNVVHKLPW